MSRSPGRTADVMLSGEAAPGNALFSRLFLSLCWSPSVLHVSLVCRVITQKNKEWCINPDAAWLKHKMQKVRVSHGGSFTCLTVFHIVA